MRMISKIKVSPKGIQYWGLSRSSNVATLMMQSYSTRALDRRLQEDLARDAREGPRVLMSLRVDFGPMG